MAKATIVICALLFVQLASGRVTRDAEQEHTALDFTNDLISKAGEVLKQIQGHAFEAVGAKNQEEFNNYIAGEAKAYASKLDTLAKDFKKTTEENIEKIGNSEAVKNLRATIDEAVENLKKENPKAANNLEELTKTSKNLIEGIKNLGESESVKQIGEIGNKILETTVDALKDVNHKIQESAKQA